MFSTKQLSYKTFDSMLIDFMRVFMNHSLLCYWLSLKFQISCFKISLNESNHCCS